MQTWQYHSIYMVSGFFKTAGSFWNMFTLVLCDNQDELGIDAYSQLKR